MERPRFSNYYAVRVTGGQEINVALMIEERIKTNNIKEVYSIIVPPNVKGYVILEAAGPHVVKLVSQGIRHVRGFAQGLVQKDDIIKFISKTTIAPAYKVGDMVEVTSGPFRGMQAQVVRIDSAKNEVVLNILESSFPLQVTVPIDQVKPVKK
ncbi:transcription elongation factor Spt5 [Sulfurisphaera ohwakuensis]|uniref:Transcription elongation factor Spt5 n=1 Tax=Sulfurisphaera ohwakuensis TaxID=69656 RepID=A0A650CHQ3_SULOH|nr:transcription elongation factor Spt5 [Sulfurisphaera ohwakuensis]MBB5252472.1 transcriptional antiterminator NusG [Sulfurisphaera ohwakuensis]QGR17077.1 transcription elongation factor Spt5 [Sulfurisphaera ohwakuensis]